MDDLDVILSPEALAANADFLAANLASEMAIWAEWVGKSNVRA